MNTEMNFIFKGCGNELPSKAETGNIFMVGKKTYVYADGWQLMIDNESLKIDKSFNCKWIDESLKDEWSKKEIPTNCKNCGGLINRYKKKCEYCGTVYG